MTETKLLPCPFCNESAELEFHEADEESNACYSIRCSNGHCRIAQTACDEGEEKEMFRKWNTRKADAQPTAGWMPIDLLTNCPNCDKQISCKYDGKTLKATRENT